VTGSYIRTAYSTDGINWTVVRFNSFGLTDIAFGNGRFVAVGYDGGIAYSSDGANWTAVPNRPFPQQDGSGSNFVVNDVAYGNGRFVAVAGNGMMAYCNW